MRQDNPYSSPAPFELTNEQEPTKFIRGNKKGPALYIVGFAFLMPMTIATVLPRDFLRMEAVGFLAPLSGCLIGALFYRWRSAHWPVDPSARGKIVIYSIISIILPSAIMFVLTGGGRAQGAGMVAICLLVGVSVAAGIILSGTRRHGTYSQTPSIDE